MKFGIILLLLSSMNIFAQNEKTFVVAVCKEIKSSNPLYKSIDYKIYQEDPRTLGDSRRKDLGLDIWRTFLIQRDYANKLNNRDMDFPAEGLNSGTFLIDKKYFLSIIGGKSVRTISLANKDNTSFGFMTIDKAIGFKKSFEATIKFKSAGGLVQYTKIACKNILN